MITVEIEPHELGLVKNQMAYRLSTDVADANAKIAMRVWVESVLYEGDYAIAYQTEHFISSDKKVEFFLEDILESTLKYNPPTLADNQAQFADTVCKRYYVDFAEKLEADNKTIVQDLSNKSISANLFTLTRKMVQSTEYKIIFQSDTPFFDNIEFRKADNSFDSFSQSLFTEVSPAIWEYKFTVVTAYYNAVLLPSFGTITIIENPLEFISQTQKFALLAGMDAIKFINRTEPLPNPRGVLEIQNTLRFITEQQYSFIYLMSMADGNLDIQFSIEYEDESIFAFTKNYGTKNKYEPVAIPVGFPQQIYGQYSSKLIWQITVSHNGNTLAILQPIRHAEDYDYEIHFANSLGGFSSFHASGELSSFIAVSDQLSRTYLPLGYTAQEGDYTTEVVSKERVYSLAIGHQERKADYRALLDLITIKQAYFKIKRQLVKIEILNTEELEDASRNYLPTFTLKFKLSLQLTALDLL